MIRILALAAVLATSLATNASASVQQITLGDFSSAKVLDFESSSLGTISGSDSLFTDFGISSVAFTGGTGLDDYGSRTNSSRALWATINGLSVVDPGATGLLAPSAYEIVFAGAQNRFGIGVHDENATFRLEFFDGASSVGSIDLATGGTADLTQWYLESTDAFNKVTVMTVAGSGGRGYAIDNLTLEAGSSSVPEPATLAIWSLLGMAIGGYGLKRRYQRAK